MMLPPPNLSHKIYTEVCGSDVTKYWKFNVSNLGKQVRKNILIRFLLRLPVVLQCIKPDLSKGKNY